MKNRIRRVALLIESSRNYGRGVLRGVARYAQVNGPWSFFTVERELHSGVPDWLRGWKGDGIIARIEDRRMAAKLLKIGCPVVDVLAQARFPGIVGFDTDAKQVAQMAADFFLQAGFNHFAFIGYPGIPFSDRRGDAFAVCVLGKNRQVLQMPLSKTRLTVKDIQAIELQGLDTELEIARWLKRQPRPLAVFACNDVRAQQVLNACRENGIRVPEDVAVMGVDNDDVLCNLCDPPLTSVEPDAERLGHEAATLLNRLMQGETVTENITKIPPIRLVERASTDVIAMDDPVMVQAVRFIRNSLSDGIAVKDVLNHVSRSRTDLENRFWQSLHCTIYEEIFRRRMALVARLLRETDLPLRELAVKAGFATSAHLCRLFRLHHGKTPMNFRAAAKIDNRL